MEGTSLLRLLCKYSVCLCLDWDSVTSWDSSDYTIRWLELCCLSQLVSSLGVTSFTGVKHASYLTNLQPDVRKALVSVVWS